MSPPLRQKDRIAELEAKLEEATNLLRLHKIQDISPLRSADSVNGAVSNLPQSEKSHTKKRRRHGTVADDNGAPEWNQKALEIDYILPRSAQKQLLRRYREDIEPVFPFPIDRTYESLREDSPLLLQTIIFAASDGVLSSEVQGDLTSAVMKLFTPARFDKVKK